MRGRIAAVALAGEFEVGFREAGNLYRKTIQSLQDVEVLDSGIVIHDLKTMCRARDFLTERDFDALLVCVGTWSEDHHLLDLLACLDRPMILHAYPDRETGSLCGVQQIGAVFRDIGFSDFFFVYGEAGSKDAAGEIRRSLQTAALYRYMRQTRFGSIGGRCAGMTETAYDEFALLHHIGARVVTIDESELLDEVTAADPNRAGEICRDLRSRFRNTTLYYRVVVYIAPLQGLCYTVKDAVDWFHTPTARRF